MLTDLSIRNFAIIDTLDVMFESGMTVLSGETGAGKSILVDALNLILGDRADADAVRDGCARADITARFDTSDAPGVTAWLSEHEMDADGECIIRRLVAREGRSRCWVNGHPTSARDLKSLGEQLIDIHGQHAHQSLLRANTQRELLDEYGNHTKLLGTVAENARALRDTEREIATIEQVNSSGDMRIDLLLYQVNELKALGLTEGEYEAIEQEHRRLAGAERLIADGQRAHTLLFEAEDASAVDQLGSVEKLLRELADIDDGFASAAEMAADARIQAEETADTLRQQLDTVEIDPQRFAALESRLAIIQDLARKHHSTPAELPALSEKLAGELADLESAGARLVSLREEREAQYHTYRNNAAKLSKARSDAAKGLSKDVTAILQTLGMPEGEFRVDVHAETDAVPAAAGTDRIEYLISANPGQAARPLERVASGGELSRISLAIEVVAVGSTRVPTLVFDEVDTGIGGGVAEIVGRQLRALGQNGQSLCVTHLPQVAALAQHHLHVYKHIENGRTATHITTLDKATRIDELARMLGGVDITKQTRAHAQDMIKRAETVGDKQDAAV